MSAKVYGYDYNGVVSIGINPSSPFDVVITGRCYDDDKLIVKDMAERNLNNPVFYKQVSIKDCPSYTGDARVGSAQHKIDTIKYLKEEFGIIVTRFFEDDPLQFDLITKALPELEVVYVKSNLVKI